jgi:hypothetical protein
MRYYELLSPGIQRAENHRKAAPSSEAVTATSRKRAIGERWGGSKKETLGASPDFVLGTKVLLALIPLGISTEHLRCQLLFGEDVRGLLCLGMTLARTISSKSISNV